MNIFITSPCPIKSAQEHCSVHLRKQIVESCQLLSTAHVVLDGKQVAMKATHVGHPSSKWSRENSSNYLWLYEHFKALCEEYTHRTGKVHKSSEWLKILNNLPENIPNKPLSEFVYVGPDEHRLKSLTCVHGAYKLYLRAKFKEWQSRIDKKQMQVVWTNRNIPKWMED